MADKKQTLIDSLKQRFDTIASEASERNPATKIVAEAIVEAIQQAFADAEVTGTATVDNKQGTIKGTVKWLE